jgi:predicted NUDIX family NTP pyrophosphohydrolase
MQSFIHEEATDGVYEFTPAPKKLSSWVSGSWRKTKQLIKNKINGFLILPMYLDDLGKQNEWQCQISGKAKHGETLAEAAQREILEEIGLLFDISTFHNSFLDYEKFKGCDVAYYAINLKEVLEVSSKDYDINISKCNERKTNVDDVHKRVSVFIYFNDIDKEFFDKIIKRKRIISNDEAGKVILLIHKNDILPHLSFY